MFDEECRQDHTSSSQEFRKRSRRGSVTPGTSSVAAVSAGGLGALSVLDEQSGRVFLVDTGADVSVFPASVDDKNTVSQGNQIAGNGSVIKTFGLKNIKVKFNTVSVLHS